LFPIETTKGGGSFGLELLLALLQIMLKGVGDWVSSVSQLCDPFHHDVNVAEFSQAPKQAAPGSLHLLPALIRIEGHKTVCHGTAATESDPEIVNWIRGETFGSAVTLFKNAVHPEGETTLSLDLWGTRNCSRGHSDNCPSRSITHFPCFGRRRPVDRNYLP
jgi:hypothetical protein